MEYFSIKSIVMGLLPPGAVKDESTFFLLVILLAAFVGAAIYLRIKKRNEPEEPASNQPS